MLSQPVLQSLLPSLPPKFRPLILPTSDILLTFWAKQWLLRIGYTHVHRPGAACLRWWGLRAVLFHAAWITAIVWLESRAQEQRPGPVWYPMKCFIDAFCGADRNLNISSQTLQRNSSGVIWDMMHSDGLIHWWFAVNSQVIVSWQDFGWYKNLFLLSTPLSQRMMRT